MSRKAITGGDFKDLDLQCGRAAAGQDMPRAGADIFRLCPAPGASTGHVLPAPGRVHEKIRGSGREGGRAPAAQPDLDLASSIIRLASA